MRWLWRKAFRDVTRRPARTLLTTLGILIGVAGIVAITATAQGLPKAQEAAFHSSSQAHITVWVDDAPARLERGIENLPNVRAAELRNALYTRWKVRDVWRDVYFIGVPGFARMEVNRLTLLEGRFPGPDECVVEASASEFYGIELGQAMTYRAGGRERKITVVGKVRSPAFLSASIINVAIAYAPAETVRKMRGKEGFNRLLVLLREPRLARETARRIDRYLSKVGIPHAAPQVNDPENYPGRREFYALASVLFLFSALGLMLSGFLVTNTVAATVIEGIREIGILKALGARRFQVMSLHLAMALLYAIPGTILGIALGAAAGFALSRRIGMLANIPVPFRLSPEAAGLGAGVGTIVTLGAGFIPAWRGASIPPREALASYGIVSTYGSRFAERMLARLRVLPPLWLMALRNLLRRRLRSGITVAAIAVSIAAYIAARGTDASVNRAIGELFEIYAADAWVYFTYPVLPRFTHRLEALPSVSVAEAWSLDDAWAEFTPVRLWGLPADTVLYRPRLLQGRWFSEGELDAAVVSSDLASRYSLRPGSTVEITLVDAKRRFRVVGVVEDHSIFLGSEVTAKVFVPFDAVARMKRMRRVANLFAVGFVEGVLPAEALEELERRFCRLEPFSVLAEEEVNTARQQSRLLALGLGAMALLVTVTGTVGVFNTLLLNVLERRRELGIMRALGAGRLAVMTVFFGEGLGMGFAGWLLGVPLGYVVEALFVARLAGRLFPMPPVMRLHWAGEALLVAGFIALAGSFGPAWASSKVPPREALAYE